MVEQTSTSNRQGSGSSAQGGQAKVERMAEQAQSAAKQEAKDQGLTQQ